MADPNAKHPVRERLDRIGIEVGDRIEELSVVAADLYNRAADASSETLAIRFIKFGEQLTKLGERLADGKPLKTDERPETD